MCGWAMAAFAGLVVSGQVAAEPAQPGAKAFVRVSERSPRYFELSDGRAYVPIGPNLAITRNGGMKKMRQWMGKLAAHGGNFARVWLSNPYFDVEHARSGEYDLERAKRIDALLAEARKHGIRLKLCLEYFRSITPGGTAWSTKAIHHVSAGGPAKNMADFLDGDRGRALFRRKIAWYAGRYGNDPTVFGWELWNEMDCVRGGNWEAWTLEMLAELHRRFPKNLAMQSLGSFDHAGKRARYRRLWRLKGNDVAQVHRYLDLGARLRICHGPVDVLTADAIREVRAAGWNRPILLGETGAVERSHSGPFKLYAKDTRGMILHDVIFAPFFAGSAGCGQTWHWEVYVDRLNLWYHFGRFAEAIRGLDPPAERFEPVELPHESLRVLALKGRRTLLAWCRDPQNTWRTELAEGKAPRRIAGAAIDLGAHGEAFASAKARVYDPWANRWGEAKVTAGRVALPAFSRSLVVRLERPGKANP